MSIWNESEIPRLKDLVLFMRANGVQKMTSSSTTIELGGEIVTGGVDPSVLLQDPLNTPVSRDQELFWSADGGDIYGTDGKPVPVPLMGEADGN